MKKFIVVTIALALTAASCNFSGGTGSMGVYRSDDSADSFHEKNAIDKKTNLSGTSVNNLVFDPSNSQTLYLAAAAGVIRSTDAAETWSVLLRNISVGDIAVDPTDSKIIYASGSNAGHGKIVKTTDGADSWKDIYSEPTNNDAVLAIAVDPSNHMHLLAGLSAGEIIETLDGGTTWQVLVDLHDPIRILRYGPNHKAYVLTQTRGLYEQSDKKTFTSLTDSLTSGYIGYNTNFSSVSKFLDLGFDQRQPAVEYLATDAGLLRTINDGKSWDFMSMPVRNQVLRTSSVAVNPKDSNNLYAVVGTTMFVSINGGVTWQTKLLPSGQEVHQILIDAGSPNVIYLGLGVKR